MSAALYSAEAEQALLGAVMYSPEAYDSIEVTLTPSCFHREDHGSIWATIQRLRSAGKAHDSLSVCDALGDDLDRCGGLPYVVQLQHAVCSIAGVKRHAEIIAERAMRRAAIAAADRIAQAAADPQRSAADVLDFVQSQVMEIGENASSKFEPEHITDAVKRAVERIQARFEGVRSPGVKTGFADLDERLGGGMRPGNLIVLAARPAMGKTSLALQIAMHAARNEAGVALFLSQEMTNEELADRALALAGRVNLQRIIDGRAMLDDDFTRITASLSAIHESRLWLDEQPSLALLDVRSKVRKVARKAGELSILVVDYLQLMDGSGANRNAEIEQISRGLKQIAKEMGIPVIALSQLSRECEKRPNKRPMTSDLRDSGAIEQDADVVLALYRDEIYNPDSMHKGLAELGVLKCRSGRSGGFVPLVFHGEYTRFDSFAGGWPELPEKSAKRSRRAFED